MPDQVGSPTSRLGEVRKQLGIVLEDDAVDEAVDVDGMTVAEHLGGALEHVRRVEHALEDEDG